MKVPEVLLLCAVAPAAAQLGLSLPPALQSLANAVNSLTAPSDTPKPAPAPAPTPTPKAHPTPTPTPIAAPPVQTSATSVYSTQTTPTFTTSISTSSTSQTSQTSETSQTTSKSTSTTSSTTNTLAEAAATPTAATASDASHGLSHSAKVGIGVGIGVFLLVGLLAAALYSFVKDRHSSEAYAAWRERRARKHSRLGSDGSTALPTIGSFFPRREKEMELSQVEYGNGTILGGGKPAAAVYDMPTIPESTQSLEREKDLPAPPVVPQQAKQVQIKRKAVPGRPPPAARKSMQKPRFSWMSSGGS